MSDIIPQNVNVPLKQCKKCTDSFPATPAYFHKNSANKDGLFLICKRCRGSKNLGIEAPEQPAEGYKRCPGCKNVHPLTEEFFNRNKAQSLGLDYQCKECKSKRGKEYSMRPTIRGKRLARQKIWNDTHKEEHKEYYQEYNDANKDHVSKQSKRYYQAHKEHTRARHKRHYQQNKGMYQAIGHAYRARKKGIGGKHTRAQIQDQLRRQKHKCYYCHTRFKKTKGKYVYHVEHTFPLSRVVGTAIPANSIDYLVLACSTCNLSKGNKFPWEWASGGRLL